MQKRRTKNKKKTKRNRRVTFTKENQEEQLLNYEAQDEQL